MKLVSVEQMRNIERASDAAGHTYAAMMERAGTAVAHVVQSRVTESLPQTLTSDLRHLILVGPGNNGGDGLVAARALRKAGTQVSCYLLQDRPDDPLLAAVRDTGCFVAAAPDDLQFRVLRRLLKGAHVIVDALLGTGTARPIGGELAKILGIVKSEIKERREPKATELIEVPATEMVPSASAGSLPLVIAVDGPTGLNYDTGALDPAAVPADVSVTFAYPKLGHFAFPGAAACGQLVVADIGTDARLAHDVTLEAADVEMVRAMLPARPVDAHKGTFGKAMIVAGSVYYSGAAALAAQAAARVGAGLVTLCPPRSIYGVVASKMTEVTYLPLPDDMGVLRGDAVNVLRERVDGYQALLVGPGLSTEKETVAFVHRLFGIEPLAKRTHIGFQAAAARLETDRPALPPLVVDADALNALAEAEGWAARLPRPAILTPHPGEMARLMRLQDKASIGEDRVGVAQRMSAEWGHVVILKGAFTVVAGPDGRAVLLPFANPALATAGSGDVLAGAIVGLLAQGLGPFEAAVCGAYLHGLAGEMARRDLGDAGVVAGDLLARLPAAIRAGSTCISSA
jgi:ADP-dependent NAD(P)H-hydrate dehydratase / NAD(P)H-hydrate epimerase